MNALLPIQIVFGLIIALFLPGYLVARLFFKELQELEKIALGFVLSIALDIVVGLFLGYNETMKNITGGISAFNLWLYLGSITIILIIAWILKNNDEYKKTGRYVSKLFEKKETHKETFKETPKETHKETFKETPKEAHKEAYKETHLKSKTHKLHRH